MLSHAALNAAYEPRHHLQPTNTFFMRAGTLIDLMSGTNSVGL